MRIDREGQECGISWGIVGSLLVDRDRGIAMKCPGCDRTLASFIFNKRVSTTGSYDGSFDVINTEVVALEMKCPECDALIFSGEYAQVLADRAIEEASDTDEG